MKKNTDVPDVNGNAESTVTEMSLVTKYSDVVSFLLIFLLLYSVLFSLIEEFHILDTYNDRLQLDMQTGTFTMNSIVVGLLILVPGAFCFLLALIGVLNYFSKRFKLSSGFQGGIIIITFVLYAVPLAVLILAHDLFFLLATLYGFLFLFGIIKYVHFTSVEMPVTVKKILNYRLPIIKKSFSFLTPHVNKLLLVGGIVMLVKSVIFLLPSLSDAITLMATFFQGVDFLEKLAGAVKTTLLPITTFSLMILASLKTLNLLPVLEFFTFLEVITVKTIMYVFILSWDRLTVGSKLERITATFPSSPTSTDSLQPSLTKKIAKSGYHLLEVRELTDIEATHWLATFSLVTIFLFEFGLKFIEIAFEVDFSSVFKLVITTAIWSLIIYHVVKGTPRHDPSSLPSGTTSNEE